jgi:hypothetical protein
LSAARTDAAALNNFQLFENFSNMVVSFLFPLVYTKIRVKSYWISKN